MNQKENKLINKKIKQNNIAKTISSIATWIFAISFISLIIFIIISSIPGFQSYGFKGIFLSNNFQTSDPLLQESSVWLPLLVTIIIVIGSLLIATPIGIKTATFIHFRVKHESIKKALKIIIEICAGIPSVVFGLFAYKSLGLIIQKIFGLEMSNSVLTSIFMMSFMLIPTIVLLTLNAYYSVDRTLINNSMSLAISKTRSIYKIFRKETRKQIIVLIIIAAGRVIGETMAVSMILSSENYKDIFSGGFFNILTSSLRPLGAVISKGMFADNGGVEFRGLLFAFGIVMFVIVMILNYIVMLATNTKNKWKWWDTTINKIGEFLLIIPTQIKHLIDKCFYKQTEFVYHDNYHDTMPKYLQERINKNKSIYVYSIYKYSLECISVTLVLSVVSWILFDIFSKGIIAASQPTSTLFMYSKNTTGQAIINTVLLILLILIISLPISLLIAIWLNEYSKNGFTKKTILFFMDSIGSTPSIIFGMFGLTLFIELLQISVGGSKGNSLLAGALTMIVVILPTFTRMNQQALQSVPYEIRANGHALGNSKWYVIRTLVLPQAYKGILSSSILTIGRILAETAPLYLTAGLSSSSSIALLNPGQTLTTRIYAQLNNPFAEQSTHIMYESALIALILIISIIFISYLIIPNWKFIKQTIREKIEIQKMLWKQTKSDIQIEKLKTQIQNNVLYISQEQAEKYKINENYIWYYKNEFIKTNIVDNNIIKKMENNYLLMTNMVK